MESKPSRDVFGDLVLSLPPLFSYAARMHRMSAILLVLGVVCACRTSARACELCDGPGSNFVALQEHVARWPLVALGEPSGRTREGRVQFRVTRILKGDVTLQEGAKVAPPGATAVLPGHVWLLLGRKANFQGGTVLMLRPATLAFVRAAPRLPSEDKPAARLRALLPWLKHEDPMVSGSARKAFAAAPYRAVREAAKDVDADDLVATLADPTRSPSSRGPLFLLLARAGGPETRKLLGAWMADPAVQRAPGYDALLAAWLVQTGASGIEPVLDLVADPEVSAAIVGGAFVRTLGFLARNEDALPKPTIVATLQRMLPERTTFGVVVEELARLEAWEATDAVLAAYARHKPEAPWTVGPVLRFLEAAPGEAAKAKRERLAAELAQPAPGPPAPKAPSGDGD